MQRQTTHEAVRDGLLRSARTVAHARSRGGRANSAGWLDFREDVELSALSEAFVLELPIGTGSV